jgi:hypothetical protein
MTTLEFISYIRSLDMKLWVEGDRLRYSMPSGTLTPELLQQLAAHKTELINFLSQNKLAAQTTEPPIIPTSRHQPLPLSYAQQRLWIFDQLNPQMAVYNVAGAIRLRGHLNLKAFEQSLNEIVRRHEMLRTTFRVIDGAAVQHISPAAFHA